MQAETSALVRVGPATSSRAPHQRMGIYDKVRRAGEQGKQVTNAVPCAEAGAVYAGRLQLTLHSRRDAAQRLAPLVHELGYCLMTQANKGKLLHNLELMLPLLSWVSIE